MVLVALMLRVRPDSVPVPHVIEWVREPVAQDVAGPKSGVSSVTFTPVRVPVPVCVPEIESVAETTPSRPQATVSPAVASAPSSAPRTTLAEHRRRNPSSSAASSSTASSARQSAAAGARIDMGQVLAAAPSSSQAGPRTATADPAQAASYWEMLLGKLRAAHQKPAGLDDGLVVRVEFVLRADGSVDGVRVLESSGNAEFDASVVAAFRRLSDLGAPPASKVGLNQVTFRTRAE